MNHLKIVSNQFYFLICFKFHEFLPWSIMLICNFYITLNHKVVQYKRREINLKPNNYKQYRKYLNIWNMGGTTTKNNTDLYFDVDHWSTVSDQQNYAIVVSSSQMTGQQIKGQLWAVTLSSNQQKTTQQQIITWYQYRKQTQLPIVKCIGISHIQKKSIGLCGSERIFNVITERIIKRWEQLPQLTFEESCYVIFQALEGYQYLCNKVGPFEVHSRMFGINQKGNLKVWLQQNFGENSLYQQKKVKNGKEQLVNDPGLYSEKEMIDTILHAIEEKCEEGAYPFSLRGKMYGQGQTFAQVRSILNDYIAQKTMKIPEKIHPNLNYILRQSQQRVYGEESVTQPYDFERKINFGVAKKKDISQVVKYGSSLNHEKFIKLKSKPNSYQKNITSQNYPNNHPGRFKGKARILYVPETTIRRLNQNEWNKKPESTKIQVSNQKNPLTHETYNYLMENPNIVTAESIYQKNQRLTENPQVGITSNNPSISSPLNLQSQLTQTRYIYYKPQKTLEIPHNPATRHLQRATSGNKPIIKFNYKPHQ